jgi:GT2 family glycosyltransferase
MAEVHVVLVNWNGWSDTVECLESLLRVRGDLTVTVCDNGSNDGSIENICAWAEGGLPSVMNSPIWVNIPQARLREPDCMVVEGKEKPAHVAPGFLTIFRTGENLGFAGGCNVGITAALEDPDCRYVWLLNNDTVAMPDALQAMLDRVSGDDRVAVCGSTLLYYHHPELVQGVGGWFDAAIVLGGHIGRLSTLESLPSIELVERDISYVMGASMLIKRNVLDRLGGLSERYFLYFEELDLSRRLSTDELLAWAPESLVFHKEGGSIGSSSQDRPSDTSIYYLKVNLLRFYLKFHPGWFFRALWRVARDAKHSARHGDWRAVKVTGMAVFDILIRRSRTGPIGHALGGGLARRR